jgi:transcriptional regulator with XRE-family HTH domain
MPARTLNGPAVKALREALGIPASTFAIECLMSPGQLSSIENCRKPASENAARRIVTALERAYPAPAHHRSKPVDLWLALTYPTLQEAA